MNYLATRPKLQGFVSQALVQVGHILYTYNVKGLQPEWSKGSSRIVNIKSIHWVLFFVIPSLPLKWLLWKCWFLTTPYEKAMHNNHHFKKAYSVHWPPPQRTMYACENDDNSGQPLTLEVTTGPNSARAISADCAPAEIRPNLVWRCRTIFVSITSNWPGKERCHWKADSFFFLC